MPGHAHSSIFNPQHVLTHSRPQRLRSFWSAPRIATSGQVQHRKSAIHGLPVTLRMFRVKFDKSDWFWSQSILFTKPFKNGMPLDQARGRDSWCWPKGARPLGTRMVLTRRNRVAKRGQHVAPNIVAIYCVPLLRLFGCRSSQILGQQCWDMLCWNVAIVWLMRRTMPLCTCVIILGTFPCSPLENKNLNWQNSMLRLVLTNA